ncbi:DNRLRE domain-containing protein [uncultured Clostridium sp.]|uniref:DNRLRE domain-containing protein n=1 Tax=uncultured Clostridium sp. TaxID=59620 RepID=UPI0028E7E487|nr:DNRLRE domain-containing protein [uncultured Clostridium sp.]
MPFVQVNPTDDVFITEYYPNNNFGNDTALFTGEYLKYNNQPDAFRSLLKFNLAGVILPGNIILGATLNLFVYRKDKTDAQLSPQTVSVFTNASNFSQNTVTWNNAPALNPTPYSINVTDADVNNYISIDITNIVIGWFYGVIPNNGITLAGIENTIDTIIGYRSNEWTITGQRPFLNIQYGIPGQPSEINIIPLANRYYYIVESDLSSPDPINIPANLFINDSGNLTNLFVGLGPNSYNNLFINGILQIGKIYSVSPNILTLDTEGTTIYKGTTIILEIIQFSASIS